MRQRILVCFFWTLVNAGSLIEDINNFSNTGFSGDSSALFTNLDKMPFITQDFELLPDCLHVDNESYIFLAKNTKTQAIHPVEIYPNEYKLPLISELIVYLKDILMDINFEFQVELENLEHTQKVQVIIYNPIVQSLSTPIGPKSVTIYKTDNVSLLMYEILKSISDKFYDLWYLRNLWPNSIGLGKLVLIESQVSEDNDSDGGNLLPEIRFLSPFGFYHHSPIKDDFKQSGLFVNYAGEETRCENVLNFALELNKNQILKLRDQDAGYNENEVLKLYNQDLWTFQDKAEMWALGKTLKEFIERNALNIQPSAKPIFEQLVDDFGDDLTTLNENKFIFPVQMDDFFNFCESKYKFTASKRRKKLVEEFVYQEDELNRKLNYAYTSLGSSLSSKDGSQILNIAKIESWGGNQRRKIII